MRTSSRASPKAHIKFAGLAAATKKRCRQSILRCFVYLDLYNIPWPNSPAQLDVTVSEYVNRQYQDEASFNQAQIVATALRRFYPACRRSLNLTTQYLTNWSKGLTRRRALPLPLNVCMGMAGAACARGDHGFAISLLLGFVALLRSVEIVTLRARQIRILRCGEAAVLMFESSKGAVRRGTPETVMVHDRGVVQMLHHRIAGLPADGHVFGGSGRDLQACITRYAGYMGLVHPDLTPYCIRRGGATWHFGKYANLHATQHLGRWAQLNTAKLYIGEAMVAQAQCNLDPAAADRLTKAHQVCAQILVRLAYPDPASVEQ